MLTQHNVTGLYDELVLVPGKCNLTTRVDFGDLVTCYACRRQVVLFPAASQKAIRTLLYCLQSTHPHLLARIRDGFPPFADIPRAVTCAHHLKTDPPRYVYSATGRRSFTSPVDVYRYPQLQRTAE